MTSNIRVVSKSDSTRIKSTMSVKVMKMWYMTILTD